MKKNEVFKNVAPLVPELKAVTESEIESSENHNPGTTTSASIKVGPIKPSIQSKGMCNPQQKKLIVLDPTTQKPQIKLSKNPMTGKKEEKLLKANITPKDS